MKRFALLALSLAMISMVFLACSTSDDPYVPGVPTASVAITVGCSRCVTSGQTATDGPAGSVDPRRACTNSFAVSAATAASRQ